MIKRILCFIISSLFLFFSSSINPHMEINGFYDKNEAIYMIHTNDEIESYSFVHLNKIEILAKSIIKIGTPQNFIEIKSITKKFIKYEKLSSFLQERGYYNILIRYKSRILRI